MTLQTWKAEFYPVRANTIADTREAILHSIQKWSGLTKENLDKHGCRIDNGDIVDESDVLSITTSSCALCNLFYCHRTCKACPLQNVREERCDEERWDEEDSPYHQWTGAGDPEPMLAWLNKALLMYDGANK